MNVSGIEFPIGLSLYLFNKTFQRTKNKHTQKHQQTLSLSLFFSLSRTEESEKQRRRDNE
jgi:hypothetical protein